MKRIISILILLSLILPVISAQEPVYGEGEYIKEIAPDGSSYLRCVIYQNKETCYDIKMSPGYKFTECALYTDNRLVGGRGVEHPVDDPYTESDCNRGLKASKIYGVLNLCMNNPGSNWEIIYQGEIVESGNCPTGKETCLITIDAKKAAYKEDTTLKECNEFFESKSLELEPMCNSIGISPSGIVGVFEVRWGDDWVIFRDLCPDELILPKWINDLMKKLFGYL